MSDIEGKAAREAASECGLAKTCSHGAVRSRHCACKILTVAPLKLRRCPRSLAALPSISVIPFRGSWVPD